MNRGAAEGAAKDGEKSRSWDKLAQRAAGPPIRLASLFCPQLPQLRPDLLELLLDRLNLIVQLAHGTLQLLLPGFQQQPEPRIEFFQVFRSRLHLKGDCLGLIVQTGGVQVFHGRPQVFQTTLSLRSLNWSLTIRAITQRFGVPGVPKTPCQFPQQHFKFRPELGRFFIRQRTL
jgi:hypothetical protein